MAITSSTASKLATLPAFLTQDRPDLHAKFIDLEWQQRERLLQGTQTSDASTVSTPAAPSPSPWARLAGDVVVARNRYTNVEPFAQNRIKLVVDDTDNRNPHHDYINASPIRLGPRRYIATQGPKETSVNHFYRMLAAETRNPAVVVMLTQTHEAGKEKCFPYYPLSARESPFKIPVDAAMGDGFEGEVELLAVRDEIRSRSQVRHLRLTARTTGAGGAEQRVEREIYHVLFSGWPDFLVPEGEDRAALLGLLQLSASLNCASSTDTATTTTTTTVTDGSSLATSLAATDQDNPRIIHCSAGVGRTGSFIALDYLLSAMYAGQWDELPAWSDPVSDTVDRMRQQRMMMVQGEAQFSFLYEVLREQFEARMRERAAGAGGGS